LSPVQGPPGKLRLVTDGAADWVTAATVLTPLSAAYRTTPPRFGSCQAALPAGQA
jgi:hypothetical protein